MIPDNVEKIVMTKEDYSRIVEQLLKEKLEAEKEIERLQNIIDKNKYTADELNEIERLQNIIKEVRELLKNDYFEDGSFTSEKKVFELLDKGE